MYISKPSKYIKAADLQGKAVKVFISHTTEEEVGQARDRKFVLYFQGKQKGLVLNSTNIETLTSAYGNESDNWGGRPVILYAEETRFAGKTTMGLRVRIPTEGGAAAPANAAARPAAQPAMREPGADEWAESDDAQAAAAF